MAFFPLYYIAQSLDTTLQLRNISSIILLKRLFLFVAKNIKYFFTKSKILNIKFELNIIFFPSGIWRWWVVINSQRKTNPAHKFVLLESSPRRHKFSVFKFFAQRT